MPLGDTLVLEFQDGRQRRRDCVFLSSVAKYSTSCSLKFSQAAGSCFIALLFHPLTQWISSMHKEHSELVLKPILGVPCDSPQSGGRGGHLLCIDSLFHQGGSCSFIMAIASQLG